MSTRFIDSLESRQFLSGDCAMTPAAPTDTQPPVVAPLVLARRVSTSAYVGTYSGKVTVTSPRIIPNIPATLVIKSISSTNIVKGTMSFPVLGYSNLPFSIKSKLDPKTGKYSIYYSKAGTTAGSGNITLTGTVNSKTKVITGSFTGNVFYKGLPVKVLGTVRITRSA